MEQKPSHPKDVWESGLAYEYYVGRWSRTRSAASSSAGWVCLLEVVGWMWDAVAGRSARPYSSQLPRAWLWAWTAHPASSPLPESTSEMPRVRFEVGEAQSLPVDTGEYEAVVSGLVLNFTPQPDQTLAEMARATEQGV